MGFDGLDELIYVTATMMQTHRVKFKRLKYFSNKNMKNIKFKTH